MAFLQGQEEKDKGEPSVSDHTQIQNLFLSHILAVLFLKGLSHEDIAVSGQFCAEVVT